jgi:hypothetical protein
MRDAGACATSPACYCSIRYQEEDPMSKVVIKKGVRKSTKGNSTSAQKALVVKSAVKAGGGYKTAYG